ncbi:LytR/AlgR family response regulator transcription factor [Mucilaginibacter sp.]
MIWKCLIIDNDPISLMIVKKYADLIEQIEILGLCDSAFQAMKIMKAKKIDLLFLNIEMPDLSGISFIKTLQYPPKVIFTTSYIEFAPEAFSLGVVDYLLKPISLERFLIAINKVISIGMPVEDEPHSSKHYGHLFFRANRKMIKVFLDDILYIESIKDYIKIYTLRDAKPLLIKYTLTTLQEMLPSDLFIRIHRSYIVSINKVTAFTNHDVEIDKIEIPIGRQYLNQMKKSSLIS